MSPFFLSRHIFIVHPLSLCGRPVFHHDLRWIKLKAFQVMNPQTTSIEKIAVSSAKDRSVLCLMETGLRIMKLVPHAKR